MFKKRPTVTWSDMPKATAFIGVHDTVQVVHLGNHDNRNYGYVKPAQVGHLTETIMLGFSDGSYRLYVFPKTMPMLDFWQMVKRVEQCERGPLEATGLKVTRVEVDV